MRAILRSIMGMLILTIGWTASVQAASPITWQIGIKGGPYKANIDGEFANSQPFETIYGESSVFMGMLEIDFQFYRGSFGSLALGGGVGMAFDDGTSLEAESEEKPGDTTSFNVVPLQLSLVYQADQLMTQFNVPFVFFGGVGVDYWLWWVRDANDEIASYEGVDAIGGTMGWHVNGGVRLLLDWFDPATAIDFDEEAGVNHSYLFAEFMYAVVDDFGSNSSFRLGDATFLFGLSFEM